jgi:hypothetical protein
MVNKVAVRKMMHIIGSGKRLVVWLQLSVRNEFLSTAFFFMMSESFVFILTYLMF